MDSPGAGDRGTMWTPSSRDSVAREFGVAQPGPLPTAGTASRRLVPSLRSPLLCKQLPQRLQARVPTQQTVTPTDRSTTDNTSLTPPPSMAAADRVVVWASATNSKVASRLLTPRTLKSSAPLANSTASALSSSSDACKKSCAVKLTAGDQATGMAASKEIRTPAEPASASAPSATERRRPSRVTLMMSTMSGVAVGSTAAMPKARAALTVGSPCSKTRTKSAGSERAKEKLPVSSATAAGAVIVCHVDLAIAVVVAMQVCGHISLMSDLLQSTISQYSSSVNDVVAVVTADTLERNELAVKVPVGSFVVKELVMDVEVIDVEVKVDVLLVVTELVVDVEVPVAVEIVVVTELVIDAEVKVDVLLLVVTELVTDVEVKVAVLLLVVAELVIDVEVKVAVLDVEVKVDVLLLVVTELMVDVEVKVAVIDVEVKVGVLLLVVTELVIEVAVPVAVAMVVVTELVIEVSVVVAVVLNETVEKVTDVEVTVPVVLLDVTELVIDVTV